jgi:hypothetical protein
MGRRTSIVGQIIATCMGLAKAVYVDKYTESGFIFKESLSYKR